MMINDKELYLYHSGDGSTVGSFYGSGDDFVESVSDVWFDITVNRVRLHRYDGAYQRTVQKAVLESEKWGLELLLRKHASAGSARNPGGPCTDNTGEFVPELILSPPKTELPVLIDEEGEAHLWPGYCSPPMWGVFDIYDNDNFIGGIDRHGFLRAAAPPGNVVPAPDGRAFKNWQFLAKPYPMEPVYRALSELGFWNALKEQGLKGI